MRPLAVFVSLAVVKLAAIMLIGPIRFPDSSEYLQIAQLIASDTSWLHDAQFTSTALPPTVFRAIGYPLVLAAANAIAGSWAPYLIILAQSALSLVALWWVIRVAHRLFGERNWWVVFIAAGWMGSVSFLFDLSLLTDSLYASLFLLVVFVSLDAVLSNAPLSTRSALCLGVLWGCSVWIRTAGLFFTPIVAIPLAVIVLRQGKRGTVTMTAFFLPALVLIGSYAAWNHYRTQYLFLTTGGQVTFLQPLFEMAKRGEPNMFAGESPLDQLVRAEAPDFTFDQLVRVNYLLFEGYKLNPKESEAAQRAKFIEAALDHKLALARNAFRNLGPKLAQMMLDPFYTWNEVGQTITGSRVLPGPSEWYRRAAHSGNPLEILLVAVAFVVRNAAYALFAAFVILPVIYVARRRRESSRDLIFLYLWALYFYVAGLYALIHLENRYLLPVIPAALLGIGGAVEMIRRRIRKTALS